MVKVLDSRTTVAEDRVVDSIGDDRLIADTSILGRPPRRPAEIERDDLLQLRSTHHDRRLVLICAPAGYGKSVLAAQWSDADPTRRSVWVGLSDADNDPVGLLLRLRAALRRLELAGDPTAQAPPMLPASQRERVIDLTRAVGQLPPFVLVLDDVHHVTSTDSLGVLGSVIDAAPIGTQIVMATRTDPDIGLPRRRANGELLEIRSGQLAMDPETTSRFLEAAQVTSQGDVVGELHERTEGWPAGIALAALAHDRRSAADGYLSGFSGHQREIADYLFDEVLDRQDAQVREFLLATSVLSRFSAELCDEMLERTDSSAVLRDLEHTNLFVVALDNHRGWYRYHHLFQEMLAAELDRSDPSARTRLLRRAADWHESHGTVEEALRYGQDSGDLERVGRLVLTNWQEFAGRGQLETVRTWLDRSTDAQIGADPSFAIGAGWVFAMLGDARRAERAAAAAAQLPLDAPSPDGATSLQSALANLRSGLGTAGLRQMLADGLAIQAAERPTRTRWLLAGCRATGVAQLLLGEVDAAIASLEEACVFTEHHDELRSVRIFCLGYLALAHLDRGNVHAAAALVAETERTIADDSVERTLQSLPARTADVAVRLRSGDRVGATRQLAATTTQLGVTAAAPWMLADLSLRCAEIALEVRDTDSAMVLLGRAGAALGRLPDAGLLPERLEQIHRRAQHVDPVFESLTPAERRVLPLLASHHTLERIGDELYVSRSTIKTHVSSIYSKLGVSSRAEAVALLEGTEFDPR